MRYVGLDLHARHFSVCVLDKDDEFVFEHSFDTSAQNLRRVVEAIAGPKRVVLEESTMAAWAYRVLKPHAQQVVVADPRHNRWISEDENIDDLSAARKLAVLLRGGMIHAVHHADEDRQVFKEIVLAYHDSVREVVRFKNKVKAKFRQHGVHCRSGAVYREGTREGWLRRLGASGARFQVRRMWATVDHLQGEAELYRREMGRRARAFGPIAAFQEVPGMGLIRAATFFAIIDTPHRFPHKRKVWTYCGVGIVRRQSDGMVGPAHLTRYGNRLLKDVVKGAAATAIAAGHNALAQQYERLVAQGVRPANARLTVARAIVSALYAMWIRGQPYVPGGGQRAHRV